MMRINEKFLSFEMWKHIAGEHKNWSHFLPAWMAGEDPLLWARDPERVFEPKPVYIPYYVEGAEEAALKHIFEIKVFSHPECWAEEFSFPKIVNATHNIRMTWHLMDRMTGVKNEKVVYRATQSKVECSSGAFPISGCSCTCKCSGVSSA